LGFIFWFCVLNFYRCKCHDYRFAGKRKTLAPGVYPEISLLNARDRRDDARKILANDADPGDIKKALNASKAALTENSFEHVAREWFSSHAHNWKETIRARLSDGWRLTFSYG
jgi:hypothetical protein